MYVHILVVIFITNCMARPYESAPKSFGTVLFTRKDLHRLKWTKRDVQLLKARRILEGIIPPVDVFSDMNTRGLTDLFHYLQMAQRSVESASRDRRTEEVLLESFCDVIGGYLKSQLLPVIRYNYYGGTIPYQTAAQFEQLYSDCKRDLRSDGRGWPAMDEKVLRQIKISVVPLPNINEICEDACKALTLCEDSNLGYTVPMPKVRWERSTSTLFLPLVNHTVFPLKVPSVTNTLANFYVIASTCLAPNSYANKQFQLNFAQWMDKEVVPHLSDDQLYPGFRGVLAVATRSPKFYRKVMDQTSRTSHCWFKRCGLSRTMVVMMSLFAVEICWCACGVLFFCLCNKNVRRGKERTRSRNSGSYYGSAYDPSTVNVALKSSSHNTYTKSRRMDNKHLGFVTTVDTRHEVRNNAPKGQSTYKNAKRNLETKLKQGKKFIRSMVCHNKESDYSSNCSYTKMDAHIRSNSNAQPANPYNHFTTDDAEFKNGLHLQTEQRIQRIIKKGLSQDLLQRYITDSVNYTSKVSLCQMETSGDRGRRKRKSDVKSQSVRREIRNDISSSASEVETKVVTYGTNYNPINSPRLDSEEMVDCETLRYFESREFKRNPAIVDTKTKPEARLVEHNVTFDNNTIATPMIAATHAAERYPKDAFEFKVQNKNNEVSFHIDGHLKCTGKQSRIPRLQKPKKPADSGIEKSCVIVYKKLNKQKLTSKCAEDVVQKTGTDRNLNASF